MSLESFFHQEAVKRSELLYKNLDKWAIDLTDLYDRRTKFSLKEEILNLLGSREEIEEHVRLRGR